MPMVTMRAMLARFAMRGVRRAEEEVRTVIEIMAPGPLPVVTRNWKPRRRKEAGEQVQRALERYWRDNGRDNGKRS